MNNFSKKTIIFSCLAVLVLAYILLVSFGLVTIRRKDGNRYSPVKVQQSSPFLSGSNSLYSERTSMVSDTADIGKDGTLTQRKVVKNGSLKLLVKKVEETAEKIQNLAGRLNGFVGNSDIFEASSGIKSGSVVIRVPADRFNEAMEEIKKLAIKVERETANTQDVTEQYIDLEARLKSYRAEEEQYLQIMRKAQTVEETLLVSQRLGEVRTRIEGAEGALQYLSRQVDMSTISVTLTAEADAEVFGIYWRPLSVIKQGFRGMLDGLVSYANGVIYILFALPVVLLWIVTIGIAGIAIWKIGYWVYRRFFYSAPPPVNK